MLFLARIMINIEYLASCMDSIIYGIMIAIIMLVINLILFIKNLLRFLKKTY
jgi:hypothetical protein